MPRSWLLDQLSDSAFPTGGFAHSSGLEAAWHQGEVRGPSALLAFARSWAWQAGYGALPLVTAAHRGTEALVELDARAETFLVSHVARRTSRTQGRAFLDTCARIFPAADAVRAQAAAQKLAMHHAPVFGAVLRSLDVELADAQHVYLSLGARGVMSAAVRLGVVGTHEAQRLLTELAPELDAVLQRCGALEVDALAQTAPLLDLFGATHDRLYSRLFQS